MYCFVLFGIVCYVLLRLLCIGSCCLALFCSSPGPSCIASSCLASSCLVPTICALFFPRPFGKMIEHLGVVSAFAGSHKDRLTRMRRKLCGAMLAIVVGFKQMLSLRLSHFKLMLSLRLIEEL